MALDLVLDCNLAGTRVEVAVLPGDRTPPGEDEV
jgi:hypothetical protein